jgi:hypothetical protein
VVVVRRPKRKCPKRIRNKRRAPGSLGLFLLLVRHSALIGVVYLSSFKVEMPPFGTVITKICHPGGGVTQLCGGAGISAMVGNRDAVTVSGSGPV